MVLRLILSAYPCNFMRKIDMCVIRQRAEFQKTVVRRFCGMLPL